MKKSFPSLTLFFPFTIMQTSHGKHIKYLILSLYYTGFRNDGLVHQCSLIGDQFAFCILMNSWIFSICVSMNYSYSSFHCSNCPIFFWLGVCSVWFLSLFKLIFFDVLYTFWYIIMWQDCLAYFLPQSQKQSFC